MLEIVFSESACGALKLAQRYGEGRYRGGAIGVIARNKDGSEPSQEERDKLRREAEERERRAWERAVSAWSHAPLSMARAMRKRPGARRFLRVSALSCQTRAQAIVN